MFIVFEGIDCSGKTTLSKKLVEKMPTNWLWTKEPTFSSEEADRLNLGSKDDVGREVEFCVDRTKHQNILLQLLNHGHSIVCDRYIWSGITYSKLFNPSAYEFAKTLYQHDFFIKPDYYVFVDTPIEVCIERCKDRAQSEEQLSKLREFYLETKKYVDKKSKIITIESVGNIDDCVNKIKDMICQ